MVYFYAKDDGFYTCLIKTNLSYISITGREKACNIYFENAILSCLKMLVFLKYSFKKYVTAASRKNAAENILYAQICSLKLLARRIQ